MRKEREMRIGLRVVWFFFPLLRLFLSFILIVLVGIHLTVLKGVGKRSLRFNIAG